MQVKTIRIVKCSSLDREGLLAGRIQELRDSGFQILFDDLAPDSAWPYCAASIQHRANALTEALLEDKSDAVMWARGGYGASELLEVLPWTSIKAAKPKPIVGFSDVCAVQSALYVMTGRVSVHGPMPSSSLWRKDGGHDVDDLLKILRGQKTAGQMPVRSHKTQARIQGKLFGGCLSVLTSLIGTPYLPKSLSGHILMFEDISENPGRVVRMLNQWRQSGTLAGVAALVFGAFTDLGNGLPNNSEILFQEITTRFDLPIFTTDRFGHVSPNQPFVIGSDATIDNNELIWTLQEPLG